MPIKDKEKRREYQRSLMRKRRQGLTENVSPSVVVSPVSPMLDPNSNVSPSVSPVRLDNLVSPKMLDPVSPELEKLVSPYEKNWKGKYLELEKETDARWKEQTETINRLKEKLREKDKENKQLIEKYSGLENNSKNTAHSLSMPNLYALITKHKKIKTIQWKYSERDIREREFLKGLRDKLWEFD